jgi:8-oxo-dGTP pyrophosphatase MutT (NUDIX family)
MVITRDFVVGVFVVKDKKVLLVKHKKLNLWLPAGGHIEPNETPEEAAMREVEEETGFGINLNQEEFHKIHILKPHHIEMHPITKDHEHICFVYFAKPVSGNLIVNRKEHDDIRWFSAEDLDSDEIPVEVRHFGKEAIREVK